jgi:rod shape-determining protein MreD
MFWLSIKTRRHLWELSLAFMVIYFIWVFQSDVLTKLSLRGLFCNLTLTFTIIWASIYSSSIPPLSSDDIKVRSLSRIARYQAMSGSISGTAVGAVFAALYASVLPAFLISYPLIGWIAGYFPLRKIQHASFYCIVLVLLGTILAEFITACQLSLMGRAEVFSCFVQIAVPEAVLNALIAPFIFVPLKAWYDFNLEREVIVNS